ncbi:MAG: hypothetical protein ABI831_23080 [Betaproteobacteria bacterium]
MPKLRALAQPVLAQPVLAQPVPKLRALAQPVLAQLLRQLAVLPRLWARGPVPAPPRPAQPGVVRRAPTLPAVGRAWQRAARQQWCEVSVALCRRSRQALR